MDGCNISGRPLRASGGGPNLAGRTRGLRRPRNLRRPIPAMIRSGIAGSIHRGWDETRSRPVAGDLVVGVPAPAGLDARIPPEGGTPAGRLPSVSLDAASDQSASRVRRKIVQDTTGRRTGRRLAIRRNPTTGRRNIAPPCHRVLVPGSRITGFARSEERRV